MNPENPQRPVIRNIGDLNSCMARRLQAICRNDFNEGLVNRMAAIITNGITLKLKDTREKVHMNHRVHDVERILDGFAEWLDMMRNPQFLSGQAGCPPPDQALLLELVDALVHVGFSGNATALSDNLSAMLIRKTATGKCASEINEIAGLIYDIVTFSAKAGKKENGLRS